MAALKHDAIGTTELIDYRNNHADFSFEMKTLSLLKSLGYSCTHSGTYNDPVSGKPREYDIRANKTIGKFKINLAVECKNLGTNFPLVTHCVPRPVADCWYWAIHHKHIKTDKLELVRDATCSETPTCVSAVRGAQNYYVKNELVAKSLDQVGLDTNNKTVTGDNRVFEKTSQAIHSCHDLVANAHRTIEENEIHLILPILIVPTGTLWQISYDSDGQFVNDPKQIDSISYYINQRWNVPGERHQYFRISHLEIVTFGYLEKCLESMFTGTPAYFLFNT